jgi:hypothetical protein
MKMIRCLILTVIAVASLWSPRVLPAQSTSATAPTTTPTVVPNNDQDLYRDLRGAPQDIKTLIISFDQTRDKYLAAQAVLLAELKKAVTDAERDKLRQALQNNRQAFLDELKDFRSDLKTELAALKGKISHVEFERVIGAAHDAAAEGGPKEHRGH